MAFRYMCDDPERAKLNRKIISRKLYIWAYIQVENWLAGNPVTDLPQWMYGEGIIGDRTKARKDRGDKRAKSLTPKRRSEIARYAANKRWHNA